MTATMRILFLLALLSGFLQFTFTTNRLRSFNHTARLSWDASLKECNDMGGSLITLYDDQDTYFVNKYIQDADLYSPFLWLGLRKNRIDVTTWSNGKIPTSSEFKTPSEVSQGEQRCVVAENGQWQNYRCSEKKHFMCQKGMSYTLIKDEKDWCQALQYCRTHFSNLVIINNDTEAEHVKHMSQGNSFWIGLLHDEWEWVDQSCSTYRYIVGFSNEKNCAIISSPTGIVMSGYDCRYESQGLCSKGSVRLKVITSQTLTWERALNYCETKHSRLLWIEDADDQKAVQQWLKYMYASIPSSGPFWISMRRSSLFGFWIWTDRIVNWANWKDGREPELDKPCQCGVINKDFTWSNKDCFERKHFICEEDIV